MMVQIYVMIYYENIADFQQKLINMTDTESMVKKFQQLQEERVRFVNKLTLMPRDECLHECQL